MSSETLLRLEDVTPGRFKTIVLDPPWPENGGGKRGANNFYPTMPLYQIAQLGEWVVRAADPEGCDLYIWATNNFTLEAGDLLRLWGWEFKTICTWHKEGRPGLGQYYRGTSEQLLFGRKLGKGCKLPYRTEERLVKGESRTFRSQGRSSLSLPRPGEHSVKPDEFFQQIERVSYPERLEMFARRPRDGWTVWGEGVGSEVWEAPLKNKPRGKRWQDCFTF